MVGVSTIHYVFNRAQNSSQASFGALWEVQLCNKLV